MINRLKLVRPTPEELAESFDAISNCPRPENNKTYKCATESPIRAVAEYEEMGAAVISYIGTVSPQSNHMQLPPTGTRTFGIPDELIVRMQQKDTENPVHIFIFCDDTNEKKNITASLEKVANEKKIAFDPGLIHLIPWDVDSYWTRDYSPWWVYNKEKNRFGISKHIYTTLGGGSVGLVGGAEDVDPRQGSGIFRCNDDYGAVRLSDFLNAPIRKWNKSEWSSEDKLPEIPTNDWFFSGMLNVGGNYMVTSKGVIASSYLVATQNQLPTDEDPEGGKPSEKTLDNRMNYIMEQTNRFLGANTYHVCTDPTGTYIGHIDCWGKFLADDKIIIAETMDKNVNKGLQEIADFFVKNNFEVYRVLSPNVKVFTEDGVEATTAPYTNCLLLNKHVYVPIVSGMEYDNYNKNALAAYKNALPDYKVIGIYGKPETPWLGTDALHCRTNTIPRGVVDNWLKSLGKK